MKKFQPQNFNDLLALVYFPFVILWVVLLALIYHFLDVSIITSLGLGTATGVILSKFSDIYQFYFRKAPDNPPDTTTTSTATTTTTTVPPDPNVTIPPAK
jgi:hypothetical protein